MSQQRCEIQIGQGKQFGADGDLSRLTGQPYSTVEYKSPGVEDSGVTSRAEVLYQQTTCEGWRSNNCELHQIIRHTPSKAWDALVEAQTSIPHLLN